VPVNQARQDIPHQLPTGPTDDITDKEKIQNST